MSEIIRINGYDIKDKKAVRFYDNVTAMKSDTGLKEGMSVKTKGYYSVNDGGACEYHITSTQNVTDHQEILNNGLYATLIIKEYANILQYGAKGDGINDDTDAIQKAINTSNIVYIPETDNHYKITSSLVLKSGTIIYGCGEKSKLLMPNDLEESIFNIYDVKDIIIDSIKLSNEGCQIGSTPDLTKNKLIYTEDVENITIKNCYFENAYGRGIEVFKTKNLNYINNIFKNATFDMLLILPEVENVIVDNCIFDTITSTYVNTYLFATGRNDADTYSFSCKNVSVKNSKFLNNPNWEGIDTHGCNGFYCENNYIENCKIGIIAHYGSTAPVTTDEVKHGDIYIKNNIIVKPAESNTYGMSVGVAPDSGFLCKNVNIENNYIDGYGSGNNLGAINIIGVKYFNILNNNIMNSKGTPINFTLVLHGDVVGNKCIDSINDYGFQYVAGCWFLNVRDNVIKNLSVSNLLYGIRTSLLNISQFENNDIVATNRYQSNGTIMSGNIGSSTNQIGKKGNFVKNEYGIITHYCTDSVIRPAKTETVTSVSLSGTSGSKIVTGTNALYYFTEGEEITLQGAGAGGIDLTTIITEFVNRDTFKIQDNISTTFTNQNPKTTAGTWTSVN